MGLLTLKEKLRCTAAAAFSPRPGLKKNNANVNVNVRPLKCIDTIHRMKHAVALMPAWYATDASQACLFLLTLKVVARQSRQNDTERKTQRRLPDCRLQGWA